MLLAGRQFLGAIFSKDQSSHKSRLTKVHKDGVLPVLHMQILDMKKGDILQGTKRSPDTALHFIVYLGTNDDRSFVGCILTHSNKHKDNVLMKKEHFRDTGDDGKRHKIVFDDTHLVSVQLVKPQDWGPYQKVGELTGEGLAFVESLVENQVPIEWEAYIRSTSK